MADSAFFSNPNLLSTESAKNYFGLNDLFCPELFSIKKLCYLLKKKKCSHHLFENYYLNYEIPQIEQKFDLLKIGIKSIVNIELRFKNIENIDILKQLERNYFYLSFFKKRVHCYTFIYNRSVPKFYYYKKSEKAIYEVKINHLTDVLGKIEDESEKDFEEISNIINIRV